MHSFSRNQLRKSNLIFIGHTRKTEWPCLYTTVLWKWHRTEMVQSLSSQMNMRETGRNSLPQHITEWGDWSENYCKSKNVLCIVLPHIILYMHYRKTTTQMKDSTHTVLDNLSDHRGHAKWQKDRFFFLFSFLLHKKTSFIWLTLAGYCASLNRNLRA